MAHPRIVDAAPFRAHVRQLISSTGAPWLLVAAGADVPIATVHALLDERPGRRLDKLRREVAERLFAVTADGLASTRRATVPTGNARRNLRALRASGWTLQRVARRCGCSVTALTAIADGTVLRMPLCVDLQVAALAEAICPRLSARAA